MHYIDIDLE
jgi:hypothetical protein